VHAERARVLPLAGICGPKKNNSKCQSPVLPRPPFLACWVAASLHFTSNTIPYYYSSPSHTFTILVSYVDIILVSMIELINSFIITRQANHCFQVTEPFPPTQVDPGASHFCSPIFHQQCLG
jgi:hypothetical protein